MSIIEGGLSLQRIQPMRLLHRPGQPIRKWRPGLHFLAVSFGALSGCVNHPANPIGPFPICRGSAAICSVSAFSEEGFRLLDGEGRSHNARLRWLADLGLYLDLMGWAGRDR